MFKWPNIPTDRSPIHELADFAELLCWRDGIASAPQVENILSRGSENDHEDGVPEEEPVSARVDETFVELERRHSRCGHGYPFTLSPLGTSLSPNVADNHRLRKVYLFLLLATRLNMGTTDGNSRKINEIDGTHAFEFVSADVAKAYFGARAESIVFGTAADSSSFPSKVDDLCRRMNEGHGFDGEDELGKAANDGKLDVAVWKHFTDKGAGKLIGFGQCKTGTSYKDELTQLQPDSFCKKWMRKHPAVTPVRMFFVTEALSSSHWKDVATDAGVLFDRCRIVDFCAELGDEVLEMVSKWTDGAANRHGLATW